MAEPSNTFDEKKNWLFTNQQEHVPLEADKMNIDSRIASLHTRRAICELIGNGTFNNGFLIDDTDEESPSIGIGDLYVCGMKIEQQDALIYNTQPYADEAPEKTLGDGIYYLDIVEEQIDEIIDEDIVDVAIGYPTVLPIRAKWVLKWLEDTGTMPVPTATHYHILIGVTSGGEFIDQRNSGNVSAGEDTGFHDREGGGLGDNLAVPRDCSRIIPVSKDTFSFYTKIQDAINYASSQTPTKETPWIIAVCPGEYNEALITGANYVSIIGVGGTKKDGARVLGAYKTPTICSTVQNMMFERTAEDTDYSWVVLAIQGSHDFIDCKFKMTTVDAGGGVLKLGDFGSGDYLFQNCDLEYNASGGTIKGPAVQSMIYCANTNPAYVTKLKVTGCRIIFTLDKADDEYYLFYFFGGSPKKYVIDSNMISVTVNGSESALHTIVWTNCPSDPAELSEPLFMNNSINVVYTDPYIPNSVWHYRVETGGVLRAQNNHWHHSEGLNIYCDGVAYIFNDVGENYSKYGTGTVNGSYICNSDGAYNQLSQLDVSSKVCLKDDFAVVSGTGYHKLPFEEILDTYSDWFDDANHQWTIRKEGWLSLQGVIQFECTVGEQPPGSEHHIEIDVEVRVGGDALDHHTFNVYNFIGTEEFTQKLQHPINILLPPMSPMIEGENIGVYVSVSTIPVALGDIVIMRGDSVGIYSHLGLSKIA